MPLCAIAYPKLIFIALAWPICKIPFGSGGNLVLTYRKKIMYYNFISPNPLAVTTHPRISGTLLNAD